MTDTADPTSGTPSFEHDIVPLFREKDRTSMVNAFDLWAYDDVVANQDAILAAVREGRMPCDGKWTDGQVELLARWIEAGSRP